MNVVLLATIAGVCGFAAIALWTQLSASKDAMKAADARAQSAEADAKKQSDRANAMQRKLERGGEERAGAKRKADKSKTQLTDLRNELSRANAALTKSQAEQQASARLGRQSQRRVEELEGMLAIKGPAKPQVVAEPEPEPALPADDPRAERRAELEAERLARTVEIERLKTERFKAKQERLAEQERQEIISLREERKTYLEEIFKRESTLRACLRKERDNYRAYIITKGQLDLALDDLYRIKHGKERPSVHETQDAQDVAQGPLPDVVEVKPKAKRSRTKKKKASPASAAKQTQQSDSIEQPTSEASIAAEPKSAKVSSKDEQPAKPGVATEAVTKPKATKKKSPKKKTPATKKKAKETAKGTSKDVAKDTAKSAAKGDEPQS
ncbi:MAG: hypothetical protein CMH53_02030 [Myxococcales bacterium]|nr:hypothetical protein [Myxococcales bacterium]